jgi:hypothetical protein
MLAVISMATACSALVCALAAGALAWRAAVVRRAEFDEVLALMHSVERVGVEIAAVKVQGGSIESDLRDVHASLLQQANERAAQTYRGGRGPLAVVRDDAGA